MKTIHVAIICLPNTLASTVVSPFDILTQAGSLWNQLKGIDNEPVFDVKLISLDGQSVLCSNGLVLNVSAGLEYLHHCDLAIISAADTTSLSTFPKTLSDALCVFYA